MWHVDPYGHGHLRKVAWSIKACACNTCGMAIHEGIDMLEKWMTVYVGLHMQDVWHDDPLWHGMQGIHQCDK